MIIALYFLFFIAYVALGFTILYNLLGRDVELNIFTPLQGLFLLLFWPYFAIVWTLYR